MPNTNPTLVMVKEFEVFQYTAFSTEQIEYLCRFIRQRLLCTVLHGAVNPFLQKQIWNCSIILWETFSYLITKLQLKFPRRGPFWVRKR